MKLKDGFVTHTLDGESILLAVGDSDFSGMVRSNSSAAFIIECLKKDTTEDEIISAMMEKYEVTHETVKRDIKGVIAKLREIGAIDE